MSSSAHVAFVLGSCHAVRNPGTLQGVVSTRRALETSRETDSEVSESQKIHLHIHGFGKNVLEAAVQQSLAFEVSCKAIIALDA